MGGKSAARATAAVEGPVTIARRLAELFAEGAAERDRERRFPHAEIEEVKRSGLFAFRVPHEAGGGGGSIADYVRVVAAFAEGDPNIAQMYITHTYGVELLNKVQASPGVKERYYRRLVDEGLFITNAYSERGTRTIFDFKTRLEPDGNGNWRLNGRKFYCTGSEGGEILYASGKVEAEDSSGDATRDLGEIRMVFLERDTPGVVIHDDWTGMGQRTTASGTIEFVNVRVPGEVCFSTEGLDTPESLFSIIGQCGFAAVFVGIAKAALGAAIDYVRERARPWPHSALERAAQDPYVIGQIGEMQTMVSTAAAMLERALGAIDEAEWRPSAEARAQVSVATSEAKAVATETSLAVSSMLFAVCGSGSVLERYGFDRFWRDARTLTLHDPVDYKYRLVGDYVLNDVPPPVTSYT